jgi:predicted permease
MATDPTPEERADFHLRLDESLRAIPGVSGVGWSGGMGIQFTSGLEAEGAPTAEPSRIVLLSTSVDTSYFRAMGIAVIEGRPFDAGDLARGSGAVIVDRDFASMLWPGRSPIGQRFRTDANGPWYRVVGVVSDPRLLGPDDRDEPWIAFHPTGPERIGYATIAIRTSGNPASSASAVREAVRTVGPDVPIHSLTTGRQSIAEAMPEPRFVLIVMGVFAGLALLLAAVGVYALVAFSVARRSREIGIRIAIGATGRSIVGSVLGEGMTLAAAGVVVGLAGAIALSRFIAALLFEVSQNDPATYAGVAAVLLLACVAALLRPAIIASAVDPASTLRSD